MRIRPDSPGRMAQSVNVVQSAMIRPGARMILYSWKDTYIVWQFNNVNIQANIYSQCHFVANPDALKSWGHKIIFTGAKFKKCFISKNNTNEFVLLWRFRKCVVWPIYEARFHTFLWKDQMLNIGLINNLPYKMDMLW